MDERDVVRDVLEEPVRLKHVLRVAADPVLLTRLRKNVSLVGAVHVVAGGAKEAHAAAVMWHHGDTVTLAYSTRVAGVDDDADGLVAKGVLRHAILPPLKLRAHRRQQDLNDDEIVGRARPRLLEHPHDTRPRDSRRFHTVAAVSESRAMRSARLRAMSGKGSECSGSCSMLRGPE